MLLSQLTAAVQGAALPDRDVNIEGMTIDSRQVKAGDLFFCIPGLRVDGHNFAEGAVSSGAVALVVERHLPFDIPQVLVPDARAAASYMAQCFYGYPAKKLTMFGVTGTKGKTTVSFQIKSVHDAAGRKCGLIGTAMTIIGDAVMPATLTTPDPVDLQRLLAKMVEEGCVSCVMEVSAHALDMRRVEGMFFDIGVYTNFSQDHLDYFGTMDAYFNAKLRFYTEGMCGWAAINADDERHVGIKRAVPVVTYGVSHPAGAYARDIEIREDGVSFDFQWEDIKIPFHLRLSGLFNVYNAMAAALACLKAGIAPGNVRVGLDSARVPGRMEIIQTGTQYKVYLDYAHSPESLAGMLDTIRQFCKGRLICVFGCGGDRDRDKRPVMGRISGEKADYTVLTSDNPRTEDPEEIINQIEQGIAETDGKYIRIENRREAIAHALRIGQGGDIIVLAGKGHEDYQEINGKKYPFDEKKIVMQILDGEK